MGDQTAEGCSRLQYHLRTRAFNSQSPRGVACGNHLCKLSGMLGAGVGTLTAKVGLGTVQFGLPYGVSNTRGQPAPAEVRSILELAQDRGVRTLDTAAQYGSSEAVLGQTLAAGHRFEIVTKAPPGVTADTVAACLERSLALLRQAGVHGLMVHHADDLTPELAARLLELKAQGLVKRVGASIYDARQVEQLLTHRGLDLVQVPVSLLDQRLVDSGHLARLKDAGFEVHARSVFLQGLLLMPQESIPEALASVRPHLERLRSRAAAAGFSMMQAALGYVLGLQHVDRVVVGVTARDELLEILAAVEALPPLTGALPELAEGAAYLDEAILNPARWSR